MKKTILLIGAVLGLSACGENNNSSNNPDLTAWQGSQVVGRSASGVAIPTRTMLDCRKITEAQNVHYYYSVIANPTPTHAEEKEGVIESAYGQVELTVHEFIQNFGSSHVASLQRGLFSLNVDFTVVENTDGTKKYSIQANELTVARIKAYFSHNPYLNSLKAGDEILTLVEMKDLVLNLTKMDLPGLQSGDVLECR